MVLTLESQDGDWNIYNMRTGETLASGIDSQEAIEYLRGNNVKKTQEGQEG